MTPMIIAGCVIAGIALLVLFYKIGILGGMIELFCEVIECFFD